MACGNRAHETIAMASTSDPPNRVLSPSKFPHFVCEFAWELQRAMDIKNHELASQPFQEQKGEMLP